MPGQSSQSNRSVTELPQTVKLANGKEVHLPPLQDKFVKKGF